MHSRITSFVPMCIFIVRYCFVSTIHISDVLIEAQILFICFLQGKSITNSYSTTMGLQNLITKEKSETKCSRILFLFFFLANEIDLIKTFHFFAFLLFQFSHCYYNGISIVYLRKIAH